MAQIQHNVVPARLLNIVTEHEAPDTQQSLFDFGSDPEELQLEPLIEKARKSRAAKFTNNWTGHEIEVLAAIVHQARKTKDHGWGNTAYFNSVSHIAAVAEGRREYSKRKKDYREKGRNRYRYIEAVKTLQEKHWLLFTHQGKVIICSTAPVTISEGHRISEDDEKTYLRVTIAPELLFEASNAVRRLPVGLSALLRKGGLKRIGDHHIKLSAYIAERVGQQNKQTAHRLATLANRAGMAHFFKQRNGRHVVKLIEATLAALQAVGAFTELERTSKTEWHIVPNELFWKPSTGVQEEQESTVIEREVAQWTG